MESRDCERPDLQSSPMLQAIDLALERHQSEVDTLGVSITPAGEWCDGHWVKFLCWYVVDEYDILLEDPQYCVVHGDLDQDAMLDHLRKTFRGVSCTLDNELTFEEDER